MTITKPAQLKSRTQECYHRPAAPPPNSLITATSICPAATVARKEHLDNLQAYNESLSETYIKLLLLSQFNKKTTDVSQ